MLPGVTIDSLVTASTEGRLYALSDDGAWASQLHQDDPDVAIFTSCHGVCAGHAMDWLAIARDGDEPLRVAPLSELTVTRTDVISVTM